MIAGERSERSGGDDQREALVAAGREGPGGDDEALARYDGKEAVNRGDDRNAEQAPRRAQHAFDEREDRVGHVLSSRDRAGAGQLR